MNKSYNIKVYDIDGNIITTINKPLSKFSFSNSINSGVDNITIDTKEPTNTTKFDWANFVEVREYSDQNKTWTPLFWGFIQSTPWLITENRDTIGLQCVWLHQMLSTVLYESWSSLTFNKSSNINTIITEIVWVFNSKQVWSPPVSYNGFIWASLIKVWTITAKNINVNFDKDTCLSAIIKCFEGSGLDFYIQPDWTLISKEKPMTPQHFLTMNKDVQNMTIKDNDKQDLVNYLRLERNGGTVVIYEDVTSQTTNWFFEIYLSKTDIVDSNTQDQFWDKYIADNKDPKKETTIEVNDRYDIASIEPGDYVKVLNSELWIDNKKILKTTYNGDTITLNIDKYVSVWQLLK